MPLDKDGKEFELGKNHVPFIEVPKGGSSCANCKFELFGHCIEKNFIKWYGTSKLPTPLDKYCSDWYEPKVFSMKEGKRIFHPEDVFKSKKEWETELEDRNADVKIIQGDEEDYKFVKAHVVYQDKGDKIIATILQEKVGHWDNSLEEGYIYEEPKQEIEEMKKGKKIKSYLAEKGIKAKNKSYTLFRTGDKGTITYHIVKSSEKKDNPLYKKRDYVHFGEEYFDTLEEAERVKKSNENYELINKGDYVTFQRPKGTHYYGKVLDIKLEDLTANVEYEFSGEDIKGDIPLDIIEVIPKSFKKGTKISRSQKEYNKEVDSYSWYVVEKNTNKVETGFEFKSDAEDQRKDMQYPENYVVISKRGLSEKGIENPNEKWKSYEKGTKISENKTWWEYTIQDQLDEYQGIKSNIKPYGIELTLKKKTDRITLTTHELIAMLIKHFIETNGYNESQIKTAVSDLIEFNFKDKK